MNFFTKILPTIVGQNRVVTRNALRSFATVSGVHNQAEISTAKTVASVAEIDRVFEDAEKIVENTSIQFNIQNLLRDELSVITRILQRLIGANNTLSEVKK